MGCGNEVETYTGSKLSLEEQSVCNYIHADCVQRKCVPRIRGLGNVARIVCVCVCEPFVLQTWEGCGRIGSFLLLPTLQRESGKAAAVGSFD